MYDLQAFPNEPILLAIVLRLGYILSRTRRLSTRPYPSGQGHG